MTDTTARRLMMSMTIIEAALTYAQDVIDQERTTIRALMDAERQNSGNPCGPTGTGDKQE